ncbi:MAG: glycosyltransferase family A protein [Thermodesulfobacteriota bacterium]
MVETSLPSSTDRGSAEPLLTVAMPVYNAGRHLRAAVASVVAQTFRDWELLIIDDGSTDDALLTIEDISDPRVRILRDGRNKGLAARLNEAIDLARGSYFARMDQDDVSYPERFQCQLDLLLRSPGIDVVAVRAITISVEDELLGYFPVATTHERICARPWLGFYFPHPTWLGHTSWFRRHRYATPGPYFCEDQELLLRTHARSRFAAVDRILFAYRVRQRINLRKQLKTRFTLCSLQVSYFLHQRQPVNFFMAILAFGGRVASDLLSGCFPDTGWLSRNIFIESTDHRQWIAVKNIMM